MGQKLPTWTCSPTIKDLKHLPAGIGSRLWNAELQWLSISVVLFTFLTCSSISFSFLFKLTIFAQLPIVRQDRRNYILELKRVVWTKITFWDHLLCLILFQTQTFLFYGIIMEMFGRKFKMLFSIQWKWMVTTTTTKKDIFSDSWFTFQYVYYTTYMA